MKLLLLFLAAASAFGQTDAPTIEFSVHYLGKDAVLAKYGHALPKSITAGSVTGVFSGKQSVTLGQGYVLQTLRQNGFPALSQTDARAIVLRAQRSGPVGWWNRYSPVAVKIMDDIDNLQIFRVISLSPAAAAGLATADAIAKATQRDVSTILADIYQTYEADGIQKLMKLGPGDSIDGTLLFEAESKPPATSAAKVFKVQIPQ